MKKLLITILVISGIFISAHGKDNTWVVAGTLEKTYDATNKIYNKNTCNYTKITAPIKGKNKSTSKTAYAKKTNTKCTSKTEWPSTPTKGTQICQDDFIYEVTDLER